MEKVFRLQRLFTVLYAVAAILVFVFALFFLTDFKDLFGLELKINQDIAYFHDVVLQGFNQRLFVFALCLVAGIALCYMLEIRSKVPDLFALAIMCAFLIAASVFCIVLMGSLGAMRSTYWALDYSMVAMEGAIEYIPNDRTFLMGSILMPVSALLFLGFAAVLIVSHIKYRKGAR